MTRRIACIHCLAYIAVCSMLHSALLLLSPQLRQRHKHMLQRRLRQRVLLYEQVLTRSLQCRKECWQLQLLCMAGKAFVLCTTPHNEVHAREQQVHAGAMDACLCHCF